MVKEISFAVLEGAEVGAGFLTLRLRLSWWLKQPILRGGSSIITGSQGVMGEGRSGHFMQGNPWAFGTHSERNWGVGLHALLPS